jgi:hypothetical protein
MTTFNGSVSNDNLFGFGNSPVTKGLEAEATETPSAASSQNRHALLTAQILKGLREISTEIPKSITAQLHSVSEALDERAFCQGLLAVGQALVSDGKLEQAALVYNSLQGIIPSTSSGQAPEHLGELKAETNKRLAALSNRGDLAYQAPVILQQLRAGLTDGVSAGGIVAAQLTFGLSRWGMVRFLERVWKASTFERLAVATGTAFGLEGMALVGAGEGLGYALGHEAVEGSPTRRERLGHAYLMMGSLRVTGSLVGAVLGLNTVVAGSAVKRLGQVLAPQVGMLGAITFTNWVAPGLNLGIAPENLWVKSLVDLAYFNAAGLGLNLIPGYRVFHHKIQMQTELAIRGVGKHLADTFSAGGGPGGISGNGELLVTNQGSASYAGSLRIGPEIYNMGKRSDPPPPSAHTSSPHIAMAEVLANTPLLPISRTIIRNDRVRNELSEIRQRWARGGKLKVDSSISAEALLERLLSEKDTIENDRGEKDLIEPGPLDTYSLIKRPGQQVEESVSLRRLNTALGMNYREDLGQIRLMRDLLIVFGRNPLQLFLDKGWKHSTNGEKLALDMNWTDLPLPWGELYCLQMEVDIGLYNRGKEGFDQLVAKHFNKNAAKAKKALGVLFSGPQGAQLYFKGWGDLVFGDNATGAQATANVASGASGDATGAQATAKANSSDSPLEPAPQRKPEEVTLEHLSPLFSAKGLPDNPTALARIIAEQGLLDALTRHNTFYLWKARTFSGRPTETVYALTALSAQSQRVLEHLERIAYWPQWLPKVESANSTTGIIQLVNDALKFEVKLEAAKTSGDGVSQFTYASKPGYTPDKDKGYRALLAYGGNFTIIPSSSRQHESLVAAAFTFQAVPEGLNFTGSLATSIANQMTIEYAPRVLYALERRLMMGPNKPITSGTLLEWKNIRQFEK